MLDYKNQRDKCCRFRFPRDIVTPTKQNQLADEDGKTVALQLHEDVVGHNPISLVELPCNQCMELPHSARGNLFYIISYISKVNGARDTDKRAVMATALEVLYCGHCLANGRRRLLHPQNRFQSLKGYMARGRDINEAALSTKMTLSCVNKLNSLKQVWFIP